MTVRSLRQPGGPAELRGPDRNATRAIRRLRRPADPVRTFGYHQVGILAALSCRVVVEDQSLSSGGLLAGRSERS